MGWQGKPTSIFPSPVLTALATPTFSWFLKIPSSLLLNVCNFPLLLSHFFRSPSNKAFPGHPADNLSPIPALLIFLPHFIPFHGTQGHLAYISLVYLWLARLLDQDTHSLRTKVFNTLCPLRLPQHLEQCLPCSCAQDVFAE